MLFCSLPWSYVGASSVLSTVGTIYQRTFSHPKKYEYLQVHKRGYNRSEARKDRSDKTACTGLFRLPYILYKEFHFFVLLLTRRLRGVIINLKICITSFASHSASAYLLEDIEDVSCSFLPCLREDVPPEVPCAILIQTAWSSFEQGLSLSLQRAYVLKTISHK
jgi:hypothetical protein